MNNQTTLKYGDDCLKISLPAGLNRRVIAPADTPAVKNIRACLTASLESPVSSRTLREKARGAQKIVIVVCDQTRPTKTADYLPHLLDYLNSCGVPDTSIDLLIAYGSHKRISDEDTGGLLGEAACSRVRVHHHDCRDEAALVSLGETSQGVSVRVNRLLVESDLVIPTGGVMHHYFAGFGGGRKMIVPGCAGLDTILANHRLALNPQAGEGLLHPNCDSGILDGNPVHEAALEAARTAGEIFTINTVQNPRGEIAHFVAGELDAAHRRACEIADEMFSIEIREPADLVIASCGGHPYDIDFIQMHKGVHHAARAVRDGGLLVICGEAKNGIGSPTFERWFDCPGLDETAAAIRRDYTLNAHTAYAMKKKVERINISLLSSLDPSFVRKMGIVPIDSFQDAIDEAVSSLCRGHAALIIPRANKTVISIPY